MQICGLSHLNDKDSEKKHYLCIKFFMVLDLRLSKRSGSAEPNFFCLFPNNTYYSLCKREFDQSNCQIIRNS